jgi:hypothetical protein
MRKLAGTRFANLWWDAEAWLTVGAANQPLRPGGSGVGLQNRSASEFPAALECLNRSRAMSRDACRAAPYHVIHFLTQFRSPI